MPKNLRLQSAPTPTVSDEEATPEQLENPEIRQRSYRPRGGAKELFHCRESEVILHSSAGTGKSRACLEKLYGIAQKYPGSRCAIVRKFRSTITQSALVTFDQLVRIPGDGVKFNSVDQEYNFPNGSQIVVAGLDDPQKILSTEFDCIYVQECTEIDEATWETLTSRLRWNHVPYQQMIGDCNPSSERHWIRRRWRAGKLHMIKMTFKDNPMLWDDRAESWTETGEAYIKRLRNLTGVMRQRLYEGEWAAAEGQIFTEFRWPINVIDAFPIPKHWSRYVSIDWGYTNPLTIQWWAEDHDGRLYLYREFYQSQMAVEDVGHLFYDLSQGETYKAIVCDHDAEDRETFSRHAAHSVDDCYAGKEKDFSVFTRKRVATMPADKRRESVRAGIEKIQARLKLAGDRRPRLYFFRDALVERDLKLDEAKKPCTVLEEIEEYVWDKIVGGRLGDRELDQPRKVNDHGCDAMRYAVMYVESGAAGVPAEIWGSQAKNEYGSAHTQRSADTLWGDSKQDYWVERWR